MKIICISGKAGHGKDTVAQIMKEIMQREGHSVLLTHYADLLKYICVNFLDWNGEKDEDGRSLLQHVGTDIIRKRNEDYWVDFIIDILKFFPMKWNYVIIPDARFPNEITKLQKSGYDVKYLKVVRPGFESNLTAKQQMHSSEIKLEAIRPDYLFTNNTLPQLYEDVKYYTYQLLNGAGDDEIRRGNTEPFFYDKDKVYADIMKANEAAVAENPNSAVSESVAMKIVTKIYERSRKRTHFPSEDEIQRMVEIELIKENAYLVAYKHMHNRISEELEENGGKNLGRRN